MILESWTKPWVFWGILVLSVYSAGCPSDPQNEYVVDGSILSDGGETWRKKAKRLHSVEVKNPSELRLQFRARSGGLPTRLVDSFAPAKSSRWACSPLAGTELSLQ